MLTDYVWIDGARRCRAATEAFMVKVAKHFVLGAFGAAILLSSGIASAAVAKSGEIHHAKSAYIGIRPLYIGIRPL